MLKYIIIDYYYEQKLRLTEWSHRI